MSDLQCATGHVQVLQAILLRLSYSGNCKAFVCMVTQEPRTQRSSHVAGIRAALEGAVPRWPAAISKTTPFKKTPKSFKSGPFQSTEPFNVDCGLT